ncbi:MAG: c-type cytochrome [Gammaproteobacteria bacterium]|nr:c-type cytochrome [Gammaproteobacteria bacterium]
MSGLILTFSGQVFAEAKALAQFKPQLSEKFKSLLSVATPDQGEIIFMRKCSSCHDHEKSGGHGKGPHLWNLLGRQAGSISGFDFSDAMKKSGHSWNLASLNYYLTNTEQAVPGRSMEFRGIRRDKVRAKLLAFLQSLNDNPPQQP